MNGEGIWIGNERDGRDGKREEGKGKEKGK